MCEFYDHDTRMAREQELQEALDGGTSREELIQKLETEVVGAQASIDAALAEYRFGEDVPYPEVDYESLWMAQDLIFFVQDATIAPKQPATV